jgi:hypothetical protein
MKKSRNIKNLRNFPKNEINCCLKDDLNHQHFLKVI